jgi:hypothetical protein
MKKRLVLMYVAVTNLGNYIIEPKDMKIYRRKKKLSSNSQGMIMK